jgi:hypothetical protein
MTDEKTEVTPPTVDELQGKVNRLTAQVETDTKAVAGVDEAVKRAMKSGALDEVLAATDSRTALLATLNKSQSQLKTATNAVVSGKRAANAGKIADVHNAMRSDGKLIAHFNALRELGVEWTKVEVSEETGKWIFNSGGAEVKRTRGAGGGGTKGQSLTVDGTEYASASAAIRAFYPDSGPLNRDSIISKLTNAGHKVS